jgi:hypothetical protein
MSCFTVFYVNNQRYYSCWLCKEIWKGRDDSLELVLEDPRKNLIIPPIEKEQEDDTIHNATSE